MFIISSSLHVRMSIISSMHVSCHKHPLVIMLQKSCISYVIFIGHLSSVIFMLVHTHILSSLHACEYTYFNTRMVFFFFFPFRCIYASKVISIISMLSCIFLSSFHATMLSHILTSPSCHEEAKFQRHAHMHPSSSCYINNHVFLSYQ